METTTSTAAADADEGSPTLGEQAEAFGRTLLKEAGEEAGRADQKASILLATASLAAAAIAGGVYGSEWSTEQLTPVGRVAWFGGWFAVAAGILALVAAVYPRQGRDRPGARRHLWYHGDAGRMKDVAEVAAALDHAVRTGDRGTAEQLLRVARIVRSKYALVRAACWLLVVGTAALLVAPAIRV